MKSELVCWFRRGCTEQMYVMEYSFVLFNSSPMWYVSIWWHFQFFGTVLLFPNQFQLWYFLTSNLQYVATLSFPFVKKFPLWFPGGFLLSQFMLRVWVKFSTPTLAPIILLKPNMSANNNIKTKYGGIFLLWKNVVNRSWMIIWRC